MYTRSCARARKTSGVERKLYLDERAHNEHWFSSKGHIYKPSTPGRNSPVKPGRRATTSSSVEVTGGMTLSVEGPRNGMTAMAHSV